MSARERILAAVEYVRSGQGGYEQCSRHFRMTIDVVRKACTKAGVPDRQLARKLPTSPRYVAPERPIVIPKGERAAPKENFVQRSSAGRRFFD